MAQNNTAVDDYLPIAEHGVIGDLRTVALVGTDATIDWFCCPHFDSPSVFGAILDKEKGGYYRISPAVEGWTPKQLYFPDTNVLVTRFLTPDGEINSGREAFNHSLLGTLTMALSRRESAPTSSGRTAALILV
jgi:GH15 family glucan-1,4-alpha-glucosidase